MHSTSPEFAGFKKVSDAREQINKAGSNNNEFVFHAKGLFPCGDDAYFTVFGPIQILSDIFARWACGAPFLDLDLDVTVVEWEKGVGNN